MVKERCYLAFSSEQANKDDEWRFGKRWFNMSEENRVTSLCCSSCGITAVDDVKLKECATCDLVRYCSDACQKNHKSQHEEDCKKRAAELRDELLFKQPESRHDGDCPICMLPMPLDISKSTMMACCSKVVCNGCSHANMLREIEGKLQRKCPFCRKSVPTKNEPDEMMMKRIKANDPVAMTQWGKEQYEKGDYSSAFEYFTKAAALGSADAHGELADMYHNGRGVEQDEKKEMYHLEVAAIGGHHKARHNLGVHEWKNCRYERAVKHWIIAATQGLNISINSLMSAFKSGMMSKDNLAAALRAHQAAVDATKSPQREVAEDYYRNRRCR
eukprot:scaffold1874_cov89-Skeletonema_dohrnii-CCMP3373.AAC.14